MKRVWDTNNDDSTWYQYDGFGRLRYRWRPGETTWDTSEAGLIYEYDLTARRLYTRQRDDDGGGSPTYLKSVAVLRRAGAAHPGPGEGRHHDEIILVDTHYNARGLQEKVTVPQYWTVPGGYFREGHWNDTYPGRRRPTTPWAASRW